MRNSTFRLPALAALALATVTPALRAADDTEITQLRAQFKALEQKLLVLERKQELRDEDSAAAAKTAAKVSVNDKGFSLASADGANVLKLRGLVQLDARQFFGDPGVVNDAFVLRRARIIAEGTFAKNTSFQIVPDFGGGTVSLVDANLGVTVDPALAFRFGRQKYPVGLELLQSDSWTFFDERSIVTNLVPNRDLGVTASGELLGGRLNYTVGVFNGVPDAANTANGDFDNDKDVVARVFATPFRNDATSPAQGLGFGLALSSGRAKSASGRAAGYKTDGQQTFFTYAAGAVADGRTWRVAPQFDYRNGPLGVIGEYVLSTVNVRPSATGAKRELRNKAWQVAAGYVVTGEDSSYNGVVPRSNFDFAKATWGAVEVVARYSRLSVDDAAFPLYASAASNADQAAAVGGGINWYLSKAVAFKFDFYQTQFGRPPGAPAVSTAPVLRQDEQSLITRFQVSF